MSYQSPDNDVTDFQVNEDTYSLPDNDTVDFTLPKKLSRTVGISGSGTTAATRLSVTKQRDIDINGDGVTTVTRSKSQPRETTFYSQKRSVVVNRKKISKKRDVDVSFTETFVETLFDLQEVFPDEEALDVSWDYQFTPRGFATEWFDETTDIPKTERGGFGVNFYGSFKHKIDIWIQYDSGDQIITSDKQSLRNASQTVSFDERKQFNEEGRYRVFVRGLRQEDTISQIDVGHIHDNL